LISRMAKWLLNRGHQVTLLANRIEIGRELFHKNLRIVEANEQIFELCFFCKSKKVWTNLKIDRPDVIKTFDLTASWIGTVVSTHIRPESAETCHLQTLSPKFRTKLRGRFDYLYVGRTDLRISTSLRRTSKPPLLATAG
jgi:hypothetical protein